MTTTQETPFSHVIDAFTDNRLAPILHYIENPLLELEDELVFYIIESTIHKLFDESDLSSFTEPILRALVNRGFKIDHAWFVHYFNALESGLLKKIRTCRQSKPMKLVPCNHEVNANLIASISHLVQLGMVLTSATDNASSDNESIVEESSTNIHQCLMSYWDLGVIKACIANGLDPTWKDEEGRTTMMFAASNVFHAVEIMTYLNKEHNISYTSMDQLHRVAVHYAGSLAALRHLNRYMSVSARDLVGFTTLHHICASALIIDDFIEMMTILVCNRFNINDQNNVKGRSPLMMYLTVRDVWMFKDDHVQGLVAMIRLFADIQAKDRKGNSVMKYASYAEMRRLSIMQNMPDLPLPSDAHLFSSILQQQGPRIQATYVIGFLRKNSQLTCMISTMVHDLPFDIILKIAEMAMPKFVPLDSSIVQKAISLYVKSSNKRYMEQLAKTQTSQNITINR